ncbi:MAG: DUF2142 domain-containing protein [Acetobacteraceae bacterium]|nr:DUF2142 domain-containing protein [Acetobacteraceae bacterium]
MLAADRRGLRRGAGYGWDRWYFSPVMLCVVLGLLGAVPLVVITPPFQVPDEAQHFARIYQLSEFHLFGRVQDGAVGGDLPSAIPELIETFLGSRRNHGPRPVEAQGLGNTLSSYALKIDLDRREFLDFTSAAGNFPLPYFPSTVAVVAGRLAGVGPLGLLHLARLANALAAIAVLAWAVRTMPTGRYTMVLFGLLPMAIYEYASVAPDAMIISWAFLFTAIALRVRADGVWTWRRQAVAAVAAVMFCPIKPVYAPILLLALPALVTSGFTARKVLAQLTVPAIALAVTGLWLVVLSPSTVIGQQGADVAGQVKYITGHPMAYVQTLLITLQNYSSYYYKTMVGVLGWLSVWLHWTGYLLPLIGLGFCLSAEPPRTSGRFWFLIWDGLLIAGCIVLVETSLYLIWTPVGADRIEGVQGRYFLPLLAVVANAVGVLGAWAGLARFEGAAVIALACIVLAEIVIAYFAVISAFRVFG